MPDTKVTAANSTPAARNILSVSRLNQLSAELLQHSLPGVWVSGEVSNLALPASGHAYFTLKDAKAQIRCALFRNRRTALRTQLSNGQHLVLQGQVTLYQARGDYQLIVEQVEDAGEGALRQAYERLKAQLAKEGLFADTRKQKLPQHPRQLGVITSASGAAIRDVLTVLQRRFPSLPVLIYPTLVQGEQASAQIVSAIQRANQRNDCDLLLLTRGGGSLEDLWPFNTEEVARAIAASEIPIVSAVGHEVDVSIADFVADVRAATPSAAAELISPDRQEYLQRLKQWQQRLLNSWQNRLQQAQHRLNNNQQRLKHPQQRLHELSQRGDELSQRLQHAWQQRLQRSRQQLAHHQQRLAARHPQDQLQQGQQRLQQLSHALHYRWQQRLSFQRQQLQRQAEQLHALSPLATLGRGYSISRDAQQQIITHPDHVQPGDHLHTQLAHGHLVSQVLSLNTDPTEEA